MENIKSKIGLEINKYLLKIKIFVFENHLLVFLLALVVIQAALLINKIPLEYDGSYNLQIPINLAKHLRYTTFIGPFKDFDYQITTGYPVLLLVGLVYKLFGIGIIQFRLVSIGFYIGLLIMTYLVAKRFSDKWFALIPLITAFFLINRNSDLEFSLLGEVPAAFFFLLGVYLLEKYKSRDNILKYLFFAISGAMLGFAVQTKMVMKFLLTGLAGILGYDIFIKRNLKNIIPIALLVVSLFSTSIGWNAYKKHALGPRYDSFVAAEKNFTNMAGSGLTSTGFVVSNELLPSKKLNLVKGLHFPFQFKYLVLLSIPIFLALAWRLFTRETTYSEIMIVATAGAFFGWWFFISNRDWFRHIVPGCLIAIPLIALPFPYIFKLLKAKENHLNTLIATVFIVSALLIAVKQGPVIGNNSLSDQREFATRVAALKKEITYEGWWQGPEIEFFLQKGFTEVNEFKKKSGDNPILVFTPVEKKHAPLDYAYWQSKCIKVLVQVGEYQACELRR